MQVNDIIQVAGFITREISIKGRSLREIEDILGFHSGRLSGGAAIAVLLQVPQLHQFDLAGYTQVADHRIDRNKMLQGLDENKLKSLVADRFTTQGIDRLVKVIPFTRHNPSMTNEEQYPPGQGVPQWKLKQEIPAQVVSLLAAGDIYR